MMYYITTQDLPSDRALCECVATASLLDRHIADLETVLHAAMALKNASFKLKRLPTVVIVPNIDKSLAVLVKDGELVLWSMVCRPVLGTTGAKASPKCDKQTKGAERVMELREQGKSLREIARETGWGKDTINKIIHNDALAQDGKLNNL